MKAEEGKRCYVLTEGFNTFMHDHTLQSGRKQFCCHCLQVLSTEEKLKHIKDCFKVSGKKSLRKMNMLDLKIMEEKWKNYSWFKQNLKAL